MVDYLYDGTFEGFLTCVYAHYYQEKADGIFVSQEYQSNLMKGYIEIETDSAKAERVYNAIRDKLSLYDLKRIYHVFASSVEGKELKLLNYIRLGFKIGGTVSMYYGHPIVFAIQEIEKKVSNEIHRMKELVRFSELENGILYSDIEPDHDVVEFLAEHFCDRYKNEAFMIHDVKRKKALVAYQGEWYVTYFDAINKGEFSQHEEDYRRLWKQYFDNIAIKERINPKCQKNRMPVRYWKHLTEFQE